MAQEEVLAVVARALIDACFRDQLFTDPEAALACFELSEDERAALSQLRPDTLDHLASEVSERLRRLGVSPGHLHKEAIRAALGLTSYDLQRLLESEAADSTQP